MAVFVSAMAQDVPTRPAGVTAESERAVAQGLEFLANAQAKDGSWRNMGGRGSYPTAMTSLAGLALISAGNTPTRGKYALHLRRGIGFILGSSQRNGLITDFQSEARPMYGHGFSMLFLSQVYGMEEDRQRRDEIRKVLRRGVDLIARSQSAQGGWNYSPDSGGDEGSVTIMQVQGLRGCRNVGIKVPKDVIDGAIRYIENSTTSDGGISYRVGQGGSRPSLAAPAAACLYNAGKYDSPLAERILKYCDSHLSANGPRGHYYYTQLYLAQAYYQAGGERWEKYYPEIQKRLLSSQRDDGSWQGDNVGTTYGTAIAIIILQLPYKNLPICQR